MDKKFGLNDTVMYGGHGVCTLVEIAEKDFGGESRAYYVLHPSYSGSSTFYVPIDSETLIAKMRHIKSADEIRTLVRQCRESTVEWIDDDRMRQNRLKQVVDGGGTEHLMRAMKALLMQQERLAKAGKKLRAADDRFLKDVEKLLFEELTLVFDMEKEDMLPFLLGQYEPSERAGA